MERREFVGAAVKTSLSSNVLSTSTSIDVDNGSNFPTGASNPFVISINRGTATEEKILCSIRSTANTFEVIERGYDGTTASAHAIGDFVEHVLDSTVIQDMNTVTNDTSIIAWMGI
jgi:hypothetical protein